MTAGDLSFGDPALVWGEDGLPRSGRFGDVYFSSDDGLAESASQMLADPARARIRKSAGRIGNDPGNRFRRPRLGKRRRARKRVQQREH